MAFGSVPVIFANLTSQVLYARAMLRAAVWSQLMYGIAVLALASWLIPESGACGLALATAFAHCVLAAGNVMAIAADWRSGK
jgi:peptidoglycan biosynthesis protein MviN/MurJ (putative lipid II flippase)